MAQNYTEQLRKDNVRDAIYEDLQNNCEVLRTSWSGNAFPANPKVGQPCYRVDEDKLYYWDGYKWSQKGGGGSAELKTMELAAATSERVSITLEGARCLDKNMMFVFVDKIAQDPSTYSMNDDGTVVNFNPAIPANAAVTLRWFDTDVGTFDTAIFASDAEFAAGELTNKAPNVKQVHYLSDMVASKLSGLDLMDVVFAPLGIDESKNKRRYLNGQVLIQEQFPAFTAAVKARMATMANAFTTETNWQAEKTNSKLGQCGKFVVDDTAGTIRLPCVVNAQGLVDLALIGGIKSESLPNITGAAGQNGYSGAISGAFYGGSAVSSSPNTGGSTTQIYFNASHSSASYQDNAPVQQEAIQYPYCIVVNTGVDEPDRPINNYQVNNVYSYGMSRYYKGTMNNNSWLKSAGQWNDGTVYTGMYNWLLEQRNAGIKPFYMWHLTTDTQVIPFITETDTLSVGTLLYGYAPLIKFGEITAISGNDVTIRNDLANQTATLSVDVNNHAESIAYIYDSSKMNVISKEEFDGWTIPINTSDYDFVINTTDQTFRLPLIAERVLVAKKEATTEDSTWYNLYSDGWCEQGGAHTFISVTTAAQSSVISLLKTMRTYSASICPRSVSGDWGAGSYTILGTSGTNFTLGAYSFRNAIDTVTIDWQVCGCSAEVPTEAEYTEVSGLYYYIGDTLQNAQLINVARIEEKLTDVNAASRGYVVESYHNGTDWYRIYSDGWCEQGGFAAPVSADGHACTVTFLKPFLDTSYGFFKTNQTTSNATNVLFVESYSSKTNTSIKIYNFNAYVSGASWFACGYIS